MDDYGSRKGVVFSKLVSTLLIDFDVICTNWRSNLG